MQDNNMENRAEEKEITSEMTIAELVGKLNICYKRNDLNQNLALNRALMFYKTCNLKMSERLFVNIFNPDFEEGVSIRIITGISSGIPITEFMEVLRKTNPTTEEVSGVIKSYWVTTGKNAVREEAKKEIETVKSEMSEEIAEERETYSKIHKEEIDRAKEIFDDVIARKEEEVNEARENFISYVAAQMEAQREITTSHQEAYVKLLAKFAEEREQEENGRNEAVEQAKLQFAKERSDLKEEYREKQEELRQAINEKKEEITGLRQKIEEHTDTIITLKEEKAKLAAWNEVYQNNSAVPQKEESTKKERGGQQPQLAQEEKKRFGRKAKARPKDKDELISIFSMKEVDDEQAMALAEAYENGAPIEHIREVAMANVSVDRIRLIFDIASLAERNG